MDPNKCHNCGKNLHTDRVTVKIDRYDEKPYVGVTSSGKNISLQIEYYICPECVNDVIDMLDRYKERCEEED